MSRQLPIRLSKLKAVKSIAAMTSSPPPSPSKSTENPKLILKFPGDLWDACDPRAHQNHPSDASQTAQSAIQTSNNQAQASVDPPRRPARPPRRCNIKIAGFQYGGPDRKSKKGSQWENKVTLRQPCLKPECTSCVKWHPHLMQDPREGLQRRQSEVEKAHTSSLEAQVSDSVAEDVFLSNGVKRCDSVMGSPECQDLLSQLRRPARFKFRSVKGRTKFAALTRAIEERRHHIAGRKHSTSASFGGRPRCRYRIKLAFESRRGREEYARLVERYL